MGMTAVCALGTAKLRRNSLRMPSPRKKISGPSPVAGGGGVPHEPAAGCSRFTRHELVADLRHRDAGRPAAAPRRAPELETESRELHHIRMFAQQPRGQAPPRREQAHCAHAAPQTAPGAAQPRRRPRPIGIEGYVAPQGQRRVERAGMRQVRKLCTRAPSTASRQHPHARAHWPFDRRSAPGRRTRLFPRQRCAPPVSVSPAAHVEGQPACRRATFSAASNRVSTSRRAARTTLATRAGWSSMSATAAARASTSPGGTRMRVTPSCTISGMPPMAEPITGTPAAIASASAGATPPSGWAARRPRLPSATAARRDGRRRT